MSKLCKELKKEHPRQRESLLQRPRSQKELGILEAKGVGGVGASERSGV